MNRRLLSRLQQTIVRMMTRDPAALRPGSKLPVAVRSLGGLVLTVGVLIPGHAAGQEQLEFPARGFYNGYLEQTSIVECDNGNPESVDLTLVLRDSNTALLAELPFTITTFGTRHIILNDLANIVNRYGTYTLVLRSAAALAARISCRTAFYRNAPAGAAKKFEFAYALPVRNALRGTVGGIFNSYNPANVSPATYNWLSVVNHSETAFDATLSLYDLDGLLVGTIPVSGLVPGERRDIALGHPEGERAGVYVLRPVNGSQPFEAFLIRYSANGTGFDFAFPLRALAGGCDGSPVQISTMGNGMTHNWLEIANIGAAPQTVGIRLRRRDGSTLTTQSTPIPPFGQSHLYVNPHLDPLAQGNVGSATVECGDTAAPIIVQSAYYGRVPANPRIEWAYAVQAGAAGSATAAEQLAIPVNTYVGMANWYKVANLTAGADAFDYTVLNQNGGAIANRSVGLAASGTADIGVHELSGSNFVGALIGSPRSGRMSGEVLRVLPRTDGQIGYIMQIPADSQPRTTLPEPQEGFFPRGSIWYQDISQAPLDGQSAAVISWLNSQGGWGLGRLQIDFSIEVLHASAETQLRSFTKTEDFYEPDCDFEQVPVPAIGAIEGEEGYQCLSDGDCHLIVAHRSSGKLFEMWRANIVGNTFRGGCLAVWDMNRVYGPSGRGENCTSADAAGYPIAPLLFTADEVAAGEIAHAIRFILPNPRIRRGVYLHPATHSTGAASGGTNAPPYGTRLRLRADYPLASLPNEGARVVARAMQKYGILLSDGGNVALTAQSDRFTTAKWDGLLGPRDLQAIKVTDFEMVDGGTRVPYTGDCVRNP